MPSISLFQYDIESIRFDLRTLEEWSEKWQLKFNGDKCKVMHIGSKNKYAKYVIDAKEIGRVLEEKDLGVIIDQSFKVGKPGPDLGMCHMCRGTGPSTTRGPSTTWLKNKRAIKVRVIEELN